MQYIVKTDFSKLQIKQRLSLYVLQEHTFSVFLLQIFTMLHILHFFAIICEIVSGPVFL